LEWRLGTRIGTLVILNRNGPKTLDNEGLQIMDEVPGTVRGETIEIDRIQDMIPHRFPMLMIDRIVDLVRDERATGVKNVSINEPYFQGHFPAEPVMPGVLIIEAMAQTAAVLVVATLGPNREGSLVYFMSVDDARFRKPVVPGDTVLIHVRKQRKRGNVWKFAAKAMVQETLVAEATYAAMIRDVPNADQTSSAAG
jgi:beta-hydroxyacyl-[acyl carrier protein] dehydratase FabZ